MKAMLCKAYGPPESLVLEEIDSAPLGPDDVRIQVRASGVNFLDLLIIEGKYQFKPELPFAPGAEVAGEVIEVGSQVSSFHLGDRVIGMSRWNGYADEAVVPADHCLPMPTRMSFETGAVFSMTYGTSYHALVQRAALSADETLLVHGSSGGVGTAAVEIGICLGAHVIATAGDDSKLDAVRERYGIDHVINYRTNPGWESHVKELTGGNGADVICDPVGGKVFEQSLRCINWGGRLLVVGFACGAIPSARANLVLLKGCQVVGVFWGAFASRNPHRNRENFRQLFTWFEAGRLQPLVSRTFPLTEAATALRMLKSREVVGKVVLSSSTDRN